MRIRRDSTHSRHWSCPDFRCGEVVPFTDGERLSIADIADSMAREAFSSSDEQRKKQGAYRRTAGALNNIREECPFLSAEDETALRDAASVLARLGDAAEKAKKIKKKIEQDAERRRAQRRTEAFTALQGLKDDEDVMRLATTALTIAHVVNRHASYYLIDADRIKRSSGQSFREALIQASRHAIHEHIGEAADSIAWRDEQPVDVLVTKLLDQIAHDQASVVDEHRALLEKYRELLRIEDATNVVTLPKKDRR